MGQLLCTHRHAAHIPLKTDSPGQVIPLITSPPGPSSESLQSDRDMEKSQEKYARGKFVMLFQTAWVLRFSHIVCGANIHEFIRLIIPQLFHREVIKVQNRVIIF